jgi:phasin
VNKAVSSKAKAVESATPVLELPKFELPNLDQPTKVPKAFWDMAEKGVIQARETFEKARKVADEVNSSLESSFNTVASGAAECNRKVLESTYVNANTSLDYAAAVFGAKTLSDLIELSTGYGRKLFEATTQQTKELASLAQKVATESVEPTKIGITNAFKKIL